MPDVFDSVFKSSAALPAFTANAPSPPATAAPSLDNGASAWPAAVIFPPTSWNCDPSLPIGDIAASSCVVAGAVKGNLDVNGPVVVDSTAVIKGNISSKGIQINSGAVIDGFCALPYASVDIDSFFGDEVDA